MMIKKITLFALFTLTFVYAEQFAVIVVPDLHLETQQNAEYAKSVMNFIVSKKTDLNIKYVVQVGDIVTHAKTESEWLHADTVFKILDDANIPYSVTSGNHDYDSMYTRNLTEYNKHFPKTRFTSKSWWNGGFADSSVSSESSINSFTVAGNRYDVVSAELLPRDTIARWLKHVADTSTGYVILNTHDYLDSNDLRTKTTTTLLPDYNMGEPLWKEYLYGSKVNTVLCGDLSGYLKDQGYRADYSASGVLCNQWLSDFQLEAGASNGGLGFLRILIFKPDSNKISTYVYSPYLDSMYTGNWRCLHSTYMFTPDTIGTIVRNKKMRYAILPSCAAASPQLLIDTINGSTTISGHNAIVANRVMIYNGPKYWLADTVTASNFTFSKAHGSIGFNGTNTTILVKHNQRLSADNADDFTSMFKISIGATQNTDWWGVNKAAGFYYGFKFYFSYIAGYAGPLLRTRYEGATTLTQYSKTILAGERQIGFTVNSGEMSIYSDGVNVDSINASAFSGDSLTKTLSYGSHSTIGYYSGKMYYALHYDTATTEVFDGNASNDFGGLALTRSNLLADTSWFYINPLILTERPESNSRFNRFNLNFRLRR